MNDTVLKTVLDRYFSDAASAKFDIVARGGENTTAIATGSFGKCVIRIWGETHSSMGVRREGDLLGELAFMTFCYESGIPVPKILISRSNNLYETLPGGSKCLVMEFVEGNEPNHYTNGMISSVAQTMAKMHGLVDNFTFPQGRSWPGTILDATVNKIEQYRELTPRPSDENIRVLDSAIAKFENMLLATDLKELPRGVIHGDIMWENIKFSGEKLAGIFDFDDCRESYFVEDIAKSIMFDFDVPEHSLFGTKGDNAYLFLKGYNAVRQLQPLEASALPMFLLARFVYQLIPHYLNPANRRLAEHPGRIDGMTRLFIRNESFFKMKD